MFYAAMRRYRLRRSAVLRSMPLSSAPSSSTVISKRVEPGSPEGMRVTACLQPLRPYRESVTIPIQNLQTVFSFVSEQVKMSGEGV